MSSNISRTDDYLLGRSVISRVRLNQQHFVYQKIFGYLLHPSIATKENLVIGDVGAGSGIWLLDLMSSLPHSTSASATFHGFDIDLSQTPPRAWLPANVNFSILDINDDLPESLVSKFDIINVRLLLLVVRNDDPTPILRNISRMLKPGGWLQWTEADNTPSQYLDFLSPTPKGSLKTSEEKLGSAMRELHYSVMPNDPRFYPTWQNKLPEFFTQIGFEAVESDVKLSTDFLPWLAFANDIVTPVYGEIIKRLPEGTERKEKCEKLYAEALNEAWLGTAWNASRMNTIGRKPAQQ